MAANFENFKILPDFPINFRKKSANVKELSQKLWELWTETFGGVWIGLMPTTCYNSVQSYLKIHLILTALFNVWILYRKSRSFWVTDIELPIDGQE